MSNERIVATWRNENGEPLTEEERAQAIRSLNELGDELAERYGTATEIDKGEDDE